MKHERNMGTLRERCRSEQGVSLIHVAIAIFVLTGFTVFVLDYGVMWLARRQAQNAADAGALAGAVARAYDETADPPSASGAAFQSAVVAAQTNEVFGEAPGVNVTWECPGFAAGGRCVRVDAHRDGVDADGDGTSDSNPLPTFFAQVFGIETQSVRATATAWVSSGNTTNCMRPFSVADKWIDNVNPTSTPIKFERWNKVGPSAVELSPKDVYTPPTGGSTGTSYTVE